MLLLVSTLCYYNKLMSTNATHSCVISIYLRMPIVSKLLPPFNRRNIEVIFELDSKLF